MRQRSAQPSALPAASHAAASPSLRLRIWLLAIGISANGLTLVLGGYSLWHSRQLYEHHAATQAENIAIGVDQTVSRSIEKIDLMLDFMVQALEHEAARGDIRPASFSPFLWETHRRIPEVEAIRVSDENGSVILAPHSAGQAINMRDRAYFQHFKQGATGSLFMSEPLLERMSQHFVVVFAKRFNHPDGRFAGVVCATVPLVHFTQLLSQFDIGAHGAITLRDDKLRLITQLPITQEPGDAGINLAATSQKIHAQHDARNKVTTFHLDHAPDGMARTISIRTLQTAPAYAMVGLASADYLAHWWTEVLETSVFLILFSSMTAVALLAIAQLLKAADLREATIADLAFKDPLTGLPTIRLTEDRLNMAMHQATRDNNKMGVMFLDLDGFKTINDDFGHAAGDFLLREVAHRIRDAIRANDTVSRIGGDEFMIVLGAITDRAAAADIATKIIAVLSTPIRYQHRLLRAPCSIGISLFPDDAQDIQTLRHLADAAMYTVKRSGKNNWAFHQPVPKNTD